jgi:malonate transporter and related proteins
VQAILTVAFPVFALVGIGWLGGRLRLLGDNGTAALNGFVTWFALPAMLFAALSRVRLDAIINLPFIVVFGGSMVATYAIGMLAARLSSRAGLAHMSLHGLAASFGNVGYMGIPLCIAAFGPEGALPATLAVVLGAAGLLTFALVVVEAGERGTASLGRVLRAVLRSPIVQAVGLGMVFSALSIPIADPLQRFLDLLASAAGPCALFAIGHFLSDQGFPRDWGEVGLATIGKVLVQPALAFALLTLYPDMDSMWAKSALLLAALPSAANVFVLAKEYDHFVAGASATILLSTIASVFTVSALVVLLKIG